MSSEDEVDPDDVFDINKITTEQTDELNARAEEYGMEKNEFFE